MTQPQESKELTVFERQLLPEVIFTEGGSAGILDEITKFARSIDKDVSTEAGRDNIRSVAYKITRTKTKLDELGEKLKEDAQKVVNATNKERRHIKETLEALAEETRQPLTDYENKEKKRVMAHEAGLVALSRQEGWHEQPEPDAEAIRTRIAQVAATSLDGWEEFTARATQTKETVLRALGLRLEGRERYEVQQAELERLRAAEEARKQAEHDARVAAESAAEATRLAEEKAALELQAAQKKAEDDAAAAAKALKDAEDKRVADKAAMDKVLADALQAAEDAKAAALKKADEDKAAALKKQQDDAAAAVAAQAAADKARADNIEHKKRINNEALAAMVLAGCHQQIAVQVITAIAKGEIPHVSIKY